LFQFQYEFIWSELLTWWWC